VWFGCRLVPGVGIALILFFFCFLGGTPTACMASEGYEYGDADQEADESEKVVA